MQLLVAYSEHDLQCEVVLMIYAIHNNSNYTLRVCALSEHPPKKVNKISI